MTSEMEIETRSYIRPTLVCFRKKQTKNIDYILELHILGGKFAMIKWVTFTAVVISVVKILLAIRLGPVHTAQRVSIV